MATTSERLAAQLASLGVDAEFSEEPITGDEAGHRVLRLARGDSRQVFDLVEGPSVRLSSVRLTTSPRPVFVHTPHVAAKTGDAFRRAGVQYLDDAGNAWLQFGDVLVDVRGRPRPEGGAARARASGNLFSNSRAQVVLALLAWPDLWEAPRREVAHAAGVSLGQAHNTLALLAQAGYGADHGRTGRTDLLDLWAAAFPSGLGQRLVLATFHGDTAPLKTTGESGAIAVSGEAAVPELLKAASLTLYVIKLNPRLAIANRWRADGEPNIVVRKKFWTDPWAPSASSSEIAIAPWPLVYADLLASDGARARAAAQQWREHREQPR